MWKGGKRSAGLLTRVRAPAATFTVMCYNVLCDKYATRQLYGYCPSWALSWEYRKKGIMEEITNCDADIISLQVRRRLSLFWFVFLFAIRPSENLREVKWNLADVFAADYRLQTVIWESSSERWCQTWLDGSLRIPTHRLLTGKG